jgi:hypothetical protein
LRRNKVLKWPPAGSMKICLQPRCTSKKTRGATQNAPLFL